VSVTSASGVNRSDPAGKPDYLLVDWGLIERWALHMGANVESKGRDNWRQASTADDERRALQSLMRHVVAFVHGVEDEDHAAAICFNVAVALRARTAQREGVQRD